jgi:hypothetical protein
MGGRAEGNITVEEASFMTDVNANFLFERSAEAIRDARVTRMKRLHFLMQACRPVYYHRNYSSKLVACCYLTT